MSWLSKLFQDGPDGPKPSEDVPPGSAGDAAANSPPEHGEILAALRQYLVQAAENNGRTLAATDIRDDIDIYEAGYLDSISASVFLVLAEKAYRVQLPDWLIGGQVNTIDKLARYIGDQLTAGQTR